MQDRHESFFDKFTISEMISIFKSFTSVTSKERHSSVGKLVGAFVGCPELSMRLIIVDCHKIL